MCILNFSKNTSFAHNTIHAANVWLWIVCFFCLMSSYFSLKLDKVTTEHFERELKIKIKTNEKYQRK